MESGEKFYPQGRKAGCQLWLATGPALWGEQSFGIWVSGICLQADLDLLLLCFPQCKAPAWEGHI
jgi:hypothetical protein